jgi:hypothetical protein
MTTRIVDLPDSNSMSNIPTFPQQQQQGASSGVPMGNNYAPINVHPNPFGNTQPTDGIMSLPPMQQDYNGLNNENIKYAMDSGENVNSNRDIQMLRDMPHQRLPSRDIPQSTTEYTNDQEIHANYIPKSILKKDYIKEYEETLTNSIEDRKKKKKSVKFMDDIFSNIQTPILVALLFFIFQMPILNRIMYKFLSKTFIYNSDGNVSWMGIAAKSIVFGIIYLFLFFIIEFCSTFC